MITGATSGIGAAAACKLAAAQADVVLVGRSLERGRAVLDKIRRVAGNDSSLFLPSDLSSIDGIRQAARSISDRCDRIDVLFNNAGVDVGKRQTTVDGLELTFAVNYLAPFLLTNLLLDLLKQSAPARVLHAASGAYKGGKVDFDDLQTERHFGQRAYNNSKLELVLFSLELAHRLEGSGVTSNCVDPGLVKTALGSTMTLGYRLMASILSPFMISADRGAETAVWAAVSPDAAGLSGAYLKRCRAIKPAAKALDRTTAAHLWLVSERIAGLN